ncbi:prolipoprotein diacylglyceryl transferase [Fulvimarina sp. 2208YS6-2-32]|uniref:Phosphatidylglycerol--prolipoprotein diacylglyceryl transferase n=1 Tax=Fulvimarina uroteuthidis TaxID=3098149 RepID=A0ABU5I587_9HYPH|nr:prolipoprotein diacylglyceryl transferase [Fulvimarina sp. 2208YS6-2-32]MDY8110088.1 prolipoprotein diacylglyceryl transferase [Fulvimarina sp. 2208YS6-2-32]
MIPLTTLGVVAYPQIDPVFLDLGVIQLRWYGLAYVVGILCGWLYGRSIVANPRLWPDRVSPITKTEVDDFILYITLGVVLGGRLGSVLFYDFERYLADPMAVFRVWEGGMAFHGGLIGVVVAVLVFCRVYRVPLWSMFDVAAVCVPFGLFFGRIANFINGELWGAPTSVAWAMVFPDAGPEPRHPSQLYEAVLEGLVLFLILRIATHRFGMLKRPRFVAGLFLTGYASARIFVEFFRMPDAHLGYLYGGWLTMGMTLSIPMLLIGLWAMAFSKYHSYAADPRLIEKRAKEQADAGRA